MHVFGRRDDCGGPSERLGAFLARDGSDGGPVGVDLDRPHACLVVGKRGFGKTHTLGVIAEGAIGARGVAPVVVDPQGDLRGLAAAGARIVSTPRVRADAVPPAAWPDLLGLDPTSPAGSLLWRVAASSATLREMRTRVSETDATPATRRAVANHLSLAASWDVFDSDGADAAALDRGGGTVFDCSELAAAPTNAICRAVAHGLYDAAAGGDLARLPWLLVDEAHVCFSGVAAPALRTVLTRGRGPGVSLVAATQRPGALPPVAVSQADLLVAHRLTANADVEALAAANPTYVDGDVNAHLPQKRGRALVVDDCAEAAHRVRIRDRRTPDEGASPRAREAAAGKTGADGGDRAVADGGTESDE